MIKLLLIALGLIATNSVHAADLFYIKNTSLYVMHDVDQGKTESQLLETSVSRYVADAGAVLYLKGTALYLISNTREPKPVRLDGGVTDFKLDDGIIAYLKGDSLHVRKVSDDATVASRSIPNANGISSFDLADGTIIFIKNVNTLYRVTDINGGTAERVIYPVGEAQVSGK
jgi:hypothetical protein